MNDEFGKPTLGTIIRRGIARKCPRCGKGVIFKRWVTLHDHCSVCGLQYLRDQGDLWGYLLFVDRAMFIFPLVVMFYFGWWNPNSEWYWGAIAVLITGMVYTIPHRNAISVGLDYMVRTRTEGENDAIRPARPGELKSSRDLWCFSDYARNFPRNLPITLVFRHMRARSGNGRHDLNDS